MVLPITMPKGLTYLAAMKPKAGAAVAWYECANLVAGYLDVNGADTVPYKRTRQMPVPNRGEDVDLRRTSIIPYRYDQLFFVDQGSAQANIDRYRWDPFAAVNTGWGASSPLGLDYAFHGADIGDGYEYVAYRVNATDAQAGWLDANHPTNGPWLATNALAAGFDASTLNNDGDSANPVVGTYWVFQRSLTDAHWSVVGNVGGWNPFSPHNTGLAWGKPAQIDTTQVRHGSYELYGTVVPAIAYRMTAMYNGYFEQSQAYGDLAEGFTYDQLGGVGNQAVGDWLIFVGALPGEDIVDMYGWDPFNPAAVGQYVPRQGRGGAVAPAGTGAGIATHPAPEGGGPGPVPPPSNLPYTGAIGGGVPVPWTPTKPNQTAIAFPLIAPVDRALIPNVPVITHEDPRTGNFPTLPNDGSPATPGDWLVYPHYQGDNDAYLGDAYGFNPFDPSLRAPVGKPAGLDFAFAGVMAGSESVAYVVTDPDQVQNDGFDYGLGFTTGPLAPGYDYAAVSLDGGQNADGSTPPNVGDYLLFGADTGQSAAGLIAAYGWNPFSAEYRNDVAALPTVSALVEAALAARLTDPNTEFNGVPLPGFPGYVYQRYWDPSGPNAYVQVNRADDGRKAMARLDAVAFGALMASENNITLTVFPSWYSPAALGFASEGYNVPNGSYNFPTLESLNGEPMSESIFVYDYGPVTPQGWNAWSSDPVDGGVAPPADYPWPGVYVLIGQSGGGGRHRKSRKELERIGFSPRQAEHLQTEVLSTPTIRELMFVHGHSYRQALTLKAGVTDLRGLIRGGFPPHQAKEIVDG